VFLLAVLVPEVVGLPGVPVLVGHGLTGRHPEEFSLLGLVGAAGPEVLVAHAEALDVLLEVLLLILLVDGGEVHAVEPAVLLGLVPVRLEEDAQVVLLAAQLGQGHREPGRRGPDLVHTVRALCIEAGEGAARDCGKQH